MKRNIKIYGNSFLKFYKNQDLKVQQKIEFILDLIRFESNVPTKFFKQLKNTDSIYEIRVITTFRSIRILCFFDGGDLIILTNAFIKKTQKTPKNEIKKAEQLKNRYINERKRGK